MAGETNLTTLIGGMEPDAHVEPYGFALASALPPGLVPFATVSEAEGLTVVAPVAALQAAGLSAGRPFARITLLVHSDLEAVGLTAAFARALADEGLSANVIAGIHHDHIFVPWERREDAVAALLRLQASAR